MKMDAGRRGGGGEGGGLKMASVIRGDGGRKKQGDAILRMIEGACQILIRSKPEDGR